jgi:PAS domain S-box-containing protein
MDIFINKLFDTSDFTARWNCGNWSYVHGWLHILSDLAIWSAYISIPIIILFMLRKQKNLPYRHVFILFMTLILACGFTHLMEAVIFWHPIYRLAGLMKLITAVIAWATVISLLPILPKLFAMRTNEDLEQEIVTRTTNLNQAKEELTTWANSIPVLSWMARPDGDFFWYNESWYTYTGTTYEDMKGWGWQKIHDPEILPAVMQNWKYCLEKSIPFEMTFPIKKHDGTFGTFLTRATPFFGSAGQVVKWCGTSTDITDQIKITELQKKNEELEMFAYIVAHDLQDPLKSNNAFMKLLATKCDVDEKANEYISIFRYNNARMQAMIVNLLTLARTAYNDINLETISCRELCNITRMNLAKLMLDSKSTIIPSEGGISADPVQIKQLFQNLVQNSIKYKHPDRYPIIKVTVEKKGNKTKCSFSDNGRGISAKQLDNILYTFRKQTEAGTGFGLLICKKIIERHGGEMKIESVENEGTTISFEI